jgi:hypothetical protein
MELSMRSDIASEKLYPYALILSKVPDGSGGQGIDFIFCLVIIIFNSLILK